MGKDGVGCTDLMLYQSMSVNGIYSLTAFILYQMEIFVPTLHSIALLFGFGIVCDMFVTVYQFRRAQYPRKEVLNPQ